MQNNLFDTANMPAWNPPSELPSLKGAKILGVDLETFDPNLKEKGPGYIRRDGYILGVSIATDDGYKKYFPMRHKQGGNIDPAIMRRWLNDQLSGDQLKVGANIAYDIGWLRNEGVKIAGPFHCTHICERLIDENAPWPKLGALAGKYLGVSKNDDYIANYVASRFGGPPTRENYGAKIFECPAEIVGPYAESDAELPIAVYHKQMVEIAKDELQRVYDLEMGLIPAVMDMQWKGIRVDVERAQFVKADTKRRLVTAYDALEQMTWRGFNAASSDDKAALFDKLGIAYPKTEAGAPSFEGKFLKKLNHPVATAILEFLALQKFDSTFLDAIINWNINGRIHSQFNQVGAVTRRFSSSNPNLQNIPSRDAEFAPLIRSMFLPEEGELLYSYDYSQVEYRGLVHFGNDAVANQLKQAYTDDPLTDIHEFVSALLGVDRKQGKNLNFGIVYGLGISALARNLNRSIDDAKKLKEEYAEKFPFAQTLMDKAKARVNSVGYVKTILGARRRFEKWEPVKWNDRKGCTPLPKEEALNKWGRNIQRAYTYSALNAVIQGSAADIIKKAMLDLYNSGNPRIAVPLLQVHDELVYSFPLTDETENDIVAVKSIMENAIKLSLPLKVDMAKGKNWGELL